MLRPTALTSTQYGLATKPSLGYEQQLFVSTQQATNLGTLLVAGANSGVYTPNVADNQTLLGAPQELLVVLNTDLSDTAPVVVNVVGTDANNNPLSGVATFTPPAYAQDQSVGFEKAWAAELIPATAGALWKTVNSVAIVCTAQAQYAQFRILGVPSVQPAVGATSYVKIGTKINLNYDPKSPMPVAVGDGRDKGAFIKAGDIDIGTLDISGKVVTSADGLMRYSGRRVTGLIKEVKEDKVGTMNIFLTGLIMTSKVKVGEDATPNTLDATAMYENIAVIMAGGVGQ